MSKRRSRHTLPHPGCVDEKGGASRARPRLQRSGSRKSLIVLLILVLVAAGCAAPPAAVPAPQSSAGEVMVSELPRVTTPTAPSEDVAELVAGNTAFALDLYASIRDREGNLFFSPYSVSQALAMAYAGARGQTEAEMAEALHFTLPQDRLHAAFNALDLDLASRSHVIVPNPEGQEEEQIAFQLNIANAAWAQEGYPFLPAYLDMLAKNYGAGMRLLDFGQDPEGSRQTINQWVSQETRERIEDLLPPGSITPLTRMVLTNAIYFKAAWEHAFSEAQTRDGDFFLADGDTITLPMMHQTETLRHGSDTDYQAVELPYQRGLASMVILLPAEGRFSEFEAGLSVEGLQAIVSGLQRKEVILTMPRFQFESPSISLVQALAKLGMASAFQSADFSGMDGTRDLYISDVIHKAFVAVDEEGTEAAAATAVIMELTAKAGEPEQVEMTIDRPFLFLIRDRITGTVFFVGRVLNPSQ